MQIVNKKIMYLVLQDTAFNKKYHNYQVGDICDCSQKHNAKYVSLKKQNAPFLKPKNKNA